MNLKEIREMIALMNENDLSEIEIERDGSKIKLKKSGGEGYEILPRTAMAFPTEVPPVTGSSASSENASSSNTKDVKSPMVGTFYRSPSPESPPFVNVGDVVEVGQVVCIVEAMKLMNEIKSEVKGKVSEIPVENAQPVEFGQSLFVIEPV
ncbi:Biotin carboxyl carrier protein of acetyl-CoA carboxylase [hydrothermal vent metagenome]|uniref:Biotin carboxyl carrier protein of acetyl-CoA carboxylase n=1 Tax=hydrothermal vent metagenome TaxID=652676 RepID=A0A3B0T4J6_9ZZZZ